MSIVGDRIRFLCRQVCVCVCRIDVCEHVPWWHTHVLIPSFTCAPQKELGALPTPRCVMVPPLMATYRADLHQLLFHIHACFCLCDSAKLCMGGVMSINLLGLNNNKTAVNNVQTGAIVTLKTELKSFPQILMFHL